MRWWFSRDPAPRAGHPTEEAVDAAANACRSLRDAEAISGRADEIAGRLAATRERNHFGDAIAAAMTRKNAH